MGDSLYSVGCGVACLARRLQWWWHLVAFSVVFLRGLEMRCVNSGLSECFGVEYAEGLGVYAETGWV